MNPSTQNQEAGPESSLLELLPLAVIISRLADGQVLYANPAFGTLMGAPHTELIGRVAPDLYYDPADRVAVLGQLRAQGRLRGVETRAKRLDTGEPRWVHIDVQPISYQGVAALITTVVDITDRKQAEAERERYARRLSVAAEIAAQVQTILDPDELLQAVIPLIKERFGLYYVHVYTLEGETLKLRAGYGEPGRIMVERGHSIPLAAEQSLVARAARTREIVVVEDVTQAPDFLPNPLLPDTRSEVAVPAIAGGKVIGVFDVQHDVTGYFTEADLDIFRALAGQIATAFQNAELYTEAQNSRAFYESIINNLPVGVWAVDQSFKPLLVNPAGQAMMGREIEDEHGQAYVEAYDVINVNTGQLYKETDLPLVKAVTQGGKHVATDAGVRWPDGTVVPMLINAAPLLDAQGRQTGGVVIFMDATELKKAQAAAEASAVRNRALLETIPDMMFVFDKQGIFLDFKAEAGQELLVPPELFLGKPAAEVLPPALAELTLSKLQQVLATGQLVTYEYQIPVGPELRDYEARMSRLGSDQALAVVRDITERKRAEMVIREAQERLQSIAVNVPGVVYQFYALPTGEVGLTYVSERAREVFGLAGDIATFFPEFTGRVYPEDQPAFLASIQQAVAAASPWRYEGRFMHPSGQLLWFRGLANPVQAPDRLLFDGLLLDVTAEKQADLVRERFTLQLRAAAEIARQVGTILDTDTLLNTVIPLIKENFGLYYAQFYLLDEATGDLVLRVGYGQVGQIMLQQGHRIPREQEQSLVARAARQKTVTVANDVMEEPDFMPNLLLPETRSEVAVPAMIGERVIGVLDVQADQAHYFSTADLDVFRTLAGQIANAFQTALLFEQQRRAEIALREAVERTRAVFDAMGEGLIVSGLMGKIEDLNDATLRLYGYDSRDELVGRSTMQLFARPYWSKAAEAMRQALQSGRSAVTEYQMLRKDQTIFEAEMNAALLRDAEGKPSGFVTIARDITARKQAEAERARLTAQLRTAADISARVTSILDPQALSERVVTLIQQQFGLYHVQVYRLDEETQELVLQASTGEAGRVLLERGHRIPFKAPQSLVARAAQTQELVVVNDVSQSPEHLPNPLLPLTRSEVAVPAIYGDRVLAVFDLQDDEVGRFGAAELDVFRTLAGQIAAAFQNARYVTELREATERFRELDRLKSEFLANMSHELRTPLNSIIGYAEVLLMGIDGELEAETLEDVKAIYENGQHLLSMINDVLDLAKIEAGRMVLKMEEVPVDQLLDEIKSSGTGLLRKYQKSETVNLEVMAEPDLPALYADRLRINQVLNNLLSNAVKFTERGFIRVRAYRSDPWLCVEVTDTGIGIPADQREVIFEKFRQVDGSSKRRAEGTGLGLAITRYLVEMHGGTIELTSEVGKGSTFLVRLPIQHQTPAEEA